jgi:hypothetical protein
VAQPLERVVLDDRAAIYVQAHLSGVNTFCSLLLEQVGADPGEIFTFAPRGTSLERLYQFDQGGLLASNLALEQAGLIRGSVEESPGAVCIIDDFNPTWGDPGSDDEADAFGFDAEVYHLLTAEDDVLTFAQVLLTSHVHWHGVAAVCEVAPLLDDTRTADAEGFAESAASVIVLTCVAYDGEGFVVWRRTRT